MGDTIQSITGTTEAHSSDTLIPEGWVGVKHTEKWGEGGLCTGAEMGESWAVATMPRAQGMGREDMNAVGVDESLSIWTHTVLEGLV